MAPHRGSPPRAGRRVHLPAVLAGVVVLALSALAAQSFAATARDARLAHRRSAGTARDARLVHRHLELAPAPDDLTLVQLAFPAARPSARISRRTLQIAVGKPFGADYLAAGAIRGRLGRPPQLLLLLVNRPSPLADPASVAVGIAARGLGGVSVHGVTDAIARKPRSARLCDLPLDGRALAPGELLPLRSQGSPLAGFDTAAALAQAYDLVCGLEHDDAFTGQIEHPSSASEPTPTPVPPLPPPRCTPCDPPPGYACPLVAHAAICVAALAPGEMRPQGAAH